MARWLRHVLRVFFTGSSFLMFFTGGAVLAYLILPLTRWRSKGTPDQKDALCRAWVADAWIFFHDYMWFWRLIDYRSSRLAAPLPEGAVVVVANHPTLVDVTAVMSAWQRLVCVAKPEHFKSPLIGRLLTYCGYIRGGDGGLFAAATVVTNSVEALQRGAAILIFPEGTRSPMNGLRDFRQGAFEMAVRANVPLQPVLITCDPPTLMRGQPWHDVPVRTAELVLTPLPLLLPPHGTPAELARRVQADFQRRLDAFHAQRTVPEAREHGALQPGPQPG